MALSNFAATSDRNQAIGRQNPTVAEILINLADLTSGAALPILKIPPNAVIHSVRMRVDTVFNSTATDTITIADAKLVDAVTAPGATDSSKAGVTTYLSAVDVRTAANVLFSEAANSCGAQYLTECWLTALWTSGGGSPTTGKVRVYVTYTITGRADESFGSGPVAIGGVNY